ncbi:Protein disulfide-isomerase 5-4 [Diplonema papillatum]|nr:Protein disulfide-isomerase 5-4 [Diplonema papillatum]
MLDFKKIDSFRTIPRDLSESTRHGAVLTVVAAVLCVVLFMCELSAYLTVTVRTRIVMDSNQDQLLKINFDVTMHDLDCSHVTVGVWDSFGSDRLNISRNIQRQRINHEGSDIGRPYTADELIEIDSSEQTLSDAEKAEYDADWSSSSDNFKHDSFGAVVESHDLTMVLFYADYCPPCRAFKPTWNEFESSVNNDGTKNSIVDADGYPIINLRVLKINCVDFKQACIDENIQSFPTVRVYKRVLGKDKQYSSYEGTRTVEGLMAFLKREAGKRHLHTGATHHSIFKEGCRLRGYVEVTRVPGTLHLESVHSEDKMLNTAFTNVSHLVHHLSFGEESPLLQSGVLPIPKEYRKHISPLDGLSFPVEKFHQAPHHYIKVVSTTFESWGGLRSYQMTHQSRVANVPKRSTPQAKFSYDLAPVEVIVTEERLKKWYDFVTSALAIVGGTYTVLGIAAGTVNMASRAFKDKVGKLG